MPQLALRDSYDVQDLLAQAKLSTLLGAEANLGGISDGKLRVGQVPCGPVQCVLGAETWPGRTRMERRAWPGQSERVGR